MKDLKYITHAQIIGCLLVIWGHSYPFVTYIPLLVMEGKGFIYMFHMSLFVFCSGFLFSYTRQTENKTLNNYLRLRFVKLLIPYFILSLIGIIPKYLFSSVLNDSLKLDCISLIRAFLIPRDNIWGHFWFLPMIFFLGTLAFVFDISLFPKMDKKKKWGLISVLLYILAFIYKPIDEMQWFGINDIIKFGWSYALGMEVFYLFGDVKESLKISRSHLMMICIICGAISIFFRIIFKHYEFSSLIVGLLMITIILLVCANLEDKLMINRNSFVAQTYQVYILSWPCQLVVEILLERILNLQWWVILPSVFVAGIIGPLILIKMIDNFETKTDTHLLSLIIGK